MVSFSGEKSAATTLPLCPSLFLFVPSPAEKSHRPSFHGQEKKRWLQLKGAGLCGPLKIRRASFTFASKKCK
ncbi:hypothetical protein MRB53_003435 [Persea americana]|uniref:Uncharacterized protein n=1 Tax=Persea americana TaxID=3435 RepID=A0ACC2MX78_PERAE|nr:hypothetical protein MRB53_003435 [Persea americana]